MKVTEGKKIRKVWREKDGKWKRNWSKEVSVVAFCTIKPIQLLGLLQKQTGKLNVPSIFWLLWMRLCFIFIVITPTSFSELKVSLLRCNTYNKKHFQASFSFLYPSQKGKKKIVMEEHRLRERKKIAQSHRACLQLKATPFLSQIHPYLLNYTRSLQDKQ